MRILAYFISLILTFSLTNSFASDDHAHDKKGSSGDAAKVSHEEEHSEGEKGHEEEHGEHKEGDAHGEESDENAQVGIDKGIVEANKAKGFKLSPEAEKNFNVNKVKISNAQNAEIPKAALVTSAMEINLYRLRDGFYKRIDFKVKVTNTNSLIISSDELVKNDEIAISGLGFLRISELAAFDGAPSGHSH